MRYPTVEEVAQINADLTGAVLLRDAGLLASAVGRPSQSTVRQARVHVRQI